MSYVYKVLEPPFKCENFENMKPKQAKEYFEWFQSQIPERINILSEAIHEYDKNIVLDYSEESLIKVWSWFVDLIEVRKKTKKEIEEEKENLPEWLHDDIEDYEVTNETLWLSMDIAIYFAEYIVKHNPSIYWGYFTKPKSYIYINRPILLGFKCKVDMEPMSIIKVCIDRNMEEKNENQLVELYNVWREEIC